jgi:hypothetical protein
MSELASVKTEQQTNNDFCFESQQKDFLFDKYAAAYYGRFTDFEPGNNSVH